MVGCAADAGGDGVCGGVLVTDGGGEGEADAGGHVGVQPW